jgi:hypothetical protein
MFPHLHPCTKKANYSMGNNPILCFKPSSPSYPLPGQSNGAQLKAAVFSSGKSKVKIQEVCGMADEVTKLVKIEDVTHDEIEIINKRRKRLYPKQDVSESSETNLVGLALSGGGIRSGVTNLGVLYEMSRVGLFRIVDYLSTVSGGGYIGCCVSSLLSLKKPDADPISGNAVYTYNKGDSDSSLFSTSWSSFPFRDLPIEGRDNGQETDNGGYGEDTAYCGNYTSRDQVFHLRDRASYLIPSSLPFGSHVIRAMGAVGASTLLSLAWFLSLLVFITTLYIIIAFPAWKTPDPVATPPVLEEQVLNDTGSAPNSKNKPIQPEKGSPEKKGATDSKSKSGEPVTDPSKSKPEAGKPADGIMNRASKAMSEIKIKLLSQIEAFSEFSQSKWIVLLAGIVWGLLSPFCMHWRGQKIDAGNRIGEDRENYIGRAQLKCISLATIPLLVVVLIVSWFFIQGEFSVPDARLLFPVVFAIGCLVGSFIMLCLLAGNLLSFSSGKMSSDADSGDKPEASFRLAWNRISRAELALCSGIFVYCLAGSYIFAALPAFILSGNAGFIAFIQAGAILVLRYYLSAKKKKM